MTLANDGDASKSSGSDFGFFLPSLWSSSSNATDRRGSVETPGLPNAFVDILERPRSDSVPHCKLATICRNDQSGQGDQGFQEVRSPASNAVSSSSCFRAEQALETKPGSISVSSNSSTSSLTPAADMVSKDKTQMNPDELRVYMRRRAAAAKDKRLCNALQSIIELPEHVGEVLQQTATELLDDVSTEVSKARHILAAKVEDPQTSTEVATRVQEIPDMVMTSFETRFAKALCTVRVRVGDVIQVLEESDLEKEEVVQHLWSIPEDVKKITRQAVKEASEESQDKVVEQLDNVMQNISEEKKTDACFKAKQDIVDSLPQTLPETIRRISEVTDINVSQATELVVEKGMGDCGYVANRVVADTLLRIKTGDTLQSAVPNNPGSSGHPELCSRVCLYFASGNCTNGLNCGFCHAHHSGRSTHLDKRHRELLRAMDFKERLHLILPILREKFENLEPRRQDLSDLLAGIAERIYGQDVRTDKKRAKHKLQVALKFMSARSLAALLHRSATSADTYVSQQQEWEEFFSRMWNSAPNGADAETLEFAPD